MVKVLHKNHSKVKTQIKKSKKKKIKKAIVAAEVDQIVNKRKGIKNMNKRNNTKCKEVHKGKHMVKNKNFYCLNQMDLKFLLELLWKNKPLKLTQIKPTNIINNIKRNGNKNKMRSFTKNINMKHGFKKNMILLKINC